MFISFAQQFEDVLLWRALKHIENGFYIDIGAQHPEMDSVSKAFYDHNWRGVHIEPMRQYANLLREHRPDEVVLEVAIAEQSGVITFYDIPDTGLSTADVEIAEGHRHQGRVVKESTVPCIPLCDVLARYVDREIHWLKIDVEGLELSVLNGWGESPVRPWIVVVESTLPNTQIETHQIWEDQLLKRGYASVLFDGLNRYYVSEHHPELKEALRYGPTVFDNFALSKTTSASYCTLFAEEIANERSRAQVFEHNWNIASAELEEFRLRLTQQDQKVAQQDQTIKQAQETRQQLERQVALLQVQLTQREQAYERVHKREQELKTKWSTAKEKIDRFRKRANEFEQESTRLSQELGSVYSSKSWKVGAPLRLGQRAVKKIVRLLKGTQAALPPATPNLESAPQAAQTTHHAQTQPRVEAKPQTEAKPQDADLTHVSSATQQVYQRLTQARNQANQDTH